MDKKDKQPRVVKLQGKSIGKGSPESLGVVSHLAGTGTRHSDSLADIRDLIQHTVANPYQWWNWSFYYNEKKSVKGTLSGYASIFNNQGATKAQLKNQGGAELIREAIKEAGGKFEATYTRYPVDSDDLEKGNYRHILFVKWIPSKVSHQLTGRRVRTDPQA